MVKFHDSNVRPPQGGWSYPIGGDLVTRYSEGEILEEMERWERNQPAPRSRADLEVALWNYYCAREPARCGLGAKPANPNGAPETPPVRAEITPEIQGPPIWLFLNTIAVQWSPGLHPYFRETCARIVVILECPKCRDEWRKILREHSPDLLNTRLAVCLWVNKVHNIVNAKKGKQAFPYEEMVRQFGAPPQ